METLVQDVRYGFRMLFKNPGFSIVAVLTLALGIGANTAIFTLVNAVLLKMLPIKDPGQLVTVGDPTQTGQRSLGTPQTKVLSYPLYLELRDRNSVFTGMYAAGSEHRVAIDEANQAATTESPSTARIVTGNYFSVLGVEPAAGRLLAPQDDTVQHGNPVVVISYAFWKNHFSLSRQAIGQSIRLNGTPYTIIGVTPQDFFGDIVGETLDFYVPVTMQSEMMHGRDWYKDLNASWLQSMGRLKPGVSVEQARANLNLVWKQLLASDYGARVAAHDPNDLREMHRPDHDIVVVPGGRGLSQVRAEYNQPLLLLMGIVGLVLLIACVNVANLLLARANSRSKEIAVRLAIGAAPIRIIRQLLTESVILAFAGGAIGSLLAVWGVHLLTKLVRSDLSTAPDVRVLLFTTAVCFMSGILFGLAPALRSTHASLTPTLNSVYVSGGRAPGKWGWGKMLVAGQVALSLLVLFAAGLLVRSLQNLRNTDLGYDRHNLLLVRLDPVGAGNDAAHIASLSRQLMERLGADPRFQGVTFSENGLFSGTEGGEGIQVPGFTAARDDDRIAADDQVGPNYFSTLGIQILRGREIGPQDTATSPRVAVINESMARFFFPNQDPVGRKFYIDDPRNKDKPLEVVGVVRDSKQQSLRDAPERRFYNAFYQTLDRKMGMNLEIRTPGDPEAAINDVRKLIQSVDPALPIIRVRSLSWLLDTTIGEQITLAKLSGFFGVLALLLACIGLYGIMSYTVAGRTREIGLRMALGAQSVDVLALVLREALLLVVVGILVGVPAALAGSRVFGSMLFGLKATDPASLATVALTLSIVAVLASYVPARRAAKVDPMVALRYE